MPSNDALSMRRTLREAGVKVPGIAKKKTDPYGIDRPEHFHPPVAVTAPLDKKKDKKKDNAPLVGHKDARRWLETSRVTTLLRLI